MTQTPTLVIRAGTIVDGSGGDPFQADIAIADGRITAIGPSLPKGTEEIDARGKLVMPGFIDVHTHYDAQVTWSSSLAPSSWNGVTTVLLGNCGVGFAPCHADQRDMLVKLMEGVEDIPEVVLTEGLPWNWHSFPDYLDALDARHYDIDIAAQVPHAALRVYVMGQRGADREPATGGGPPGHGGADRSRNPRRRARLFHVAHVQSSHAGRPPHSHLGAEAAELTAIAHAMRSAGAGWLQIVSDFDDQDQEFGLFRRAGGGIRPAGDVDVAAIRHEAQWLAHPAGSYRRRERRRTAHHRTGPLTSDQRPARLRTVGESVRRPAQLQADRPAAVCRADAASADPEFRATLLSETLEFGHPAQRLERWDRLFLLGDPPNYEPTPEQSIAAHAMREHRPPDELAYDLLLQRDGRTILYMPMTNFAAGNLDVVREMIAHPDTLLGLGDGGAHVGVMCDATATSYTLTHWTRDRSRGALFPLAWAVKRLTGDNAAAIGLHDRGLLRAGMKADLNVIDYDRLMLRPPEITYDLPAGGKRLVQRTEGIDATVVSGIVVYRDGAATGALPGRLVRGPQGL